MEKNENKVDAAKVARLLAIKPAVYSDFTEEEARDFLATLYQAGELDAVRTYYYTTIRRPYLFRSRADKEAIPAEVATKYYYGGVALDVLEGVVGKIKNTANINAFYDGNFSIFVREYNRARSFCIAANQEREALGEATYKEKVVTIRDAEASAMYSPLAGAYLVIAERGTGVYLINTRAVLLFLRNSVSAFVRNAKAYGIVSTSAGDVVEALDLKAFAGDFPEIAARTAGEIANLREQYKAFFSFLSGDIAASRTIYADIPEKTAEDYINAYDPALVLALLDEDVRKEEDYKYNLFVFGNNSPYVYDKVTANLLSDGKEDTK